MAPRLRTRRPSWSRSTTDRITRRSRIGIQTSKTRGNHGTPNSDKQIQTRSQFKNRDMLPSASKTLPRPPHVHPIACCRARPTTSILCAFELLHLLTPALIRLYVSHQTILLPQALYGRSLHHAQHWDAPSLRAPGLSQSIIKSVVRRRVDQRLVVEVTAIKQVTPPLAQCASPAKST